LTASVLPELSIGSPALLSPWLQIPVAQNLRHPDLAVWAPRLPVLSGPETPRPFLFPCLLPHNHHLYNLTIHVCWEQGRVSAPQNLVNQNLLGDKISK
jgi:hypothetical protein